MTILARIVLRYLRRVDPDVTAQLKISLQSFNARRKVWQESKVAIVEADA
jgi:hypothetical protein